MIMLDATKPIKTEEDTTAAVKRGRSKKRPANDTATMLDAIDNDAPPPPPPIRTITLPLPADCQTAVELLLQKVPLDPNAKESDFLWFSGFRISRAYKVPGGYPTETEDIAETDDLDNGWEMLGDSIADAVKEVSLWIGFHSVDDDLESGDPQSRTAQEAIESWLEKLDSENTTESIFDQPEGEQPTTDATVEIAASPPTVVAATIPAVSPDDAQQVFDRRKQELAWQIAKFSIELGEAKSAVKRLTKARDSAVAELESHIDRGREELPLFDQVKKEAEPQPAGSDAAAAPVVATAGEEASVISEAGMHCAKALEEIWRQVKLSKVKGLTPKIVEVLEEHEIYTIGDWVDWPVQHAGTEYTQLSGITEKRFEKIQAAMLAATTGATA